MEVHLLAFSRPCHTFSISVWCLILSQHSWDVLVEIITPTEFTCQINLCNCTNQTMKVLGKSEDIHYYIYEMETVFVIDTENHQTALLNMERLSNRPTGHRLVSISSLKSQSSTKRRKMFIKRCKMVPERQKSTNQMLIGVKVTTNSPNMT